MRNGNRIVNFGHERVPDEIYEDYERIEKLREKIEQILIKSDLVSEEEKNTIKSLFYQIHENFRKMEVSSCQMPRPRS